MKELESDSLDSCGRASSALSAGGDLRAQGNHLESEAAVARPSGAPSSVQVTLQLDVRERSVPILGNASNGSLDSGRSAHPVRSLRTAARQTCSAAAAEP